MHRTQNRNTNPEPRTRNRELFVLSPLLVVLLALPAAANPESDRLRAQAYQHLYDLDHDEAARDMEAAVAADPRDIAAERGLAVIAWLHTSFLRGTLAVDDYLGDITRRHVAMEPPPPDLAARFAEHVTRATRLAEAAVALRPTDAGAHYELGAAVGSRASYMASIEGKLIAAFRVARRAYHEHERVLELAPGHHDTQLVVGTYRYVVSTLSMPMRVLAYVAGFGSGKERGIQMIEDAAASPGEARAEALVALVLVYNREARYDAAMRTLAELQRAYPRNRILWLEAGSTALRAGHSRDADALLTEELARLAKDPRPRMPGEEALWSLKRGIARVDLRRTQEGVEDLRRALVPDARPWVRERTQAELDTATARGQRSR